MELPSRKIHRAKDTREHVPAGLMGVVNALLLLSLRFEEKENPPELTSGGFLVVIG
jgi:hypothetical protein